MVQVRVAAAGSEYLLKDLDLPLSLEMLVPGSAWEVELGIGKGGYLLAQATAGSGIGFLGVEIATKYYRLARDRCFKRRLENVVLIRGEARLLMAAVLPKSFARAVHIYFPDPWPKSRHQLRRLLDAESVDLVLGLLEPGGRLMFASDHVSYGKAVQQLLTGHPGLAVSELSGPWPGGARTNYEIKYEREGRPIVRLEARLKPDRSLFHPSGAMNVLAAVPGHEPESEDSR